MRNLTAHLLWERRTKTHLRMEPAPIPWSFPRKPESRAWPKPPWMPAFAGMTSGAVG
jgi:hypothetical protein